MPVPSRWGSPAPQPASWGTTSGLWGGLGKAAEPSFSHRFTQRYRRQSQARWPCSHLCWKEGPSPGEPPLAPAHSRAGNSSWSREGRKGFISVTDLENVSVHPRHSWGLFLPVANAEENGSVLPQARKGHSTCTHRYRSSPISQVFHSNTGR